MTPPAQPPVVHRVEDADWDWAADTGPAADVRRIAAAASDAAGRPVVDEASHLELANRGLTTAILLVAARADGERPEGFAYLRGLSGPGRPELDLVVHPQARRRGLGSALARTMLNLVNGIPVTAWSHGDHPDAAALAGTFDFIAARELWLMRRMPEPVAPADVPHGVHLRSFEPGDEEGLLAVNAAAFIEHPEQGDLDSERLQERMAQSWFDPAGLLVAEQGERLVGFHWTKVHRDDDGRPLRGEVYVIAVHPSMSGLGLGRVLLVAGLRHLAALGVPETILYVEGTNKRAIMLYESAGFTHSRRDTDVMYAGTG